jgi:competence protein ComEC
MFVILLAVLCGVFAFLKRRHSYILGTIFFVCVALGMVRAAIAETPLPTSFASDLHHKVSYEGVVVSDPDVRDANQRVEVRVTKGGESTGLLAVAPRNAEIMVGDTVSVTGVLLTPEAFADDNGRTFRYDKYLERDGVRFIMNFAFISVESPAPWYSLPAALARAKRAFLSGIAATLPEPHASLAGGIVIGGKSGLGTELQNTFIRSGLVQIIVLSGYNVMVVAEWVMALLAFTKLPRRWSALAGALALLVFVGIAGASATAIRAALMALIALYARATGRTYVAGRALLLVVLLMLIWNPLYLVFDPGFGLSVAATAGLIWLAPIIEILLERAALRLRRVRQVQRSETLSENAVRRVSFWKNAAATTLAAQIAVLPLLLYDTGNLSLVSVPANLLVMPFVPLAMLFSALAGFAGMLFGSIALTTGGSLAPLLGIVIAYPAYLANAFLLFIAHESAALPLAAFTLPPFPFWLVLAAYAALIYFASSKRFSTTLQLRFAKKAST